jgi:hypothetical protein
VQFGRFLCVGILGIWPGVAIKAANDLSFNPVGFVWISRFDHSAGKFAQVFGGQLAWLKVFANETLYFLLFGIWKLLDSANDFQSVHTPNRIRAMEIRNSGGLRAKNCSFCLASGIRVCH